MKEGFSRGIYPSLEEREAFMSSACDYVEEQLRQSFKKSCLVSFSFTNDDMRQIFKRRFHRSKWLLLQTPSTIADTRISQRDGHFYKVQSADESVRNGPEWGFDQVTFDHTVINGLDDRGTNAEKVVDAIKSLLRVNDRFVEPKLYFRHVNFPHILSPYILI